MFSTKNILCSIVIWMSISRIQAHCVCEDSNHDICLGCAGPRLEDDAHYHHYGSSSGLEHPANGNNCWCNKLNLETEGGFPNAIGPKLKKLKCDCTESSYTQRNLPYHISTIDIQNNLNPEEISLLNSARKQKLRWNNPYQDNVQFSQLTNGKFIKHDLDTYPLRPSSVYRGIDIDERLTQRPLKYKNLAAQKSYLKRKCALCRKSTNLNCCSRN